MPSGLLRRVFEPAYRERAREVGRGVQAGGGAERASDAIERSLGAKSGRPGR